MEREEVLISDKNSLQSTSLLRQRIEAVCFLQCTVKDSEKQKSRDNFCLGSGFYAKVVVKGATFHGIFTNNHVLASEKEAREAYVTFGFDELGKGKKLRIWPDIIFYTNKDLDYTFIGIQKDEVDKLELGIEPIDFVQEPPVNEGDEIFIFQHPCGRPKEFSHGEVMKVQKPFVCYKADTEFGSSGSPVLRNLQLLAIHHKGRERAYNKGTLCSEIIEHMNTGRYSEPIMLFSDSQDKEIFEVGSPQAKRKQMNPRDPNSIPTEDDLDNLAQEIIPFYKELGRKLGIGNSKIEEIARDTIYVNIKEKAFQVLMEWHEKAGDASTYGALSKALRALKKNRLAQTYC